MTVKRVSREQKPSGWERLRARRAAGTLLKDLREIRLLFEMEEAYGSDYDTFTHNSPVEAEERSKSVSFALPEPADIREIPAEAYEKLQDALDGETRDSIKQNKRMLILKGVLIILLVSTFLMFSAASLILILNRRAHNKTSGAAVGPQKESASTETEQTSHEATTTSGESETQEMLFPSGSGAQSEVSSQTEETSEMASQTESIAQSQKIKHAVEVENHDSDSSEPACPGCEDCDCLPKPVQKPVKQECGSCDCSGSREAKSCSEDCSCSCSGSCDSESSESCDCENCQKEAPTVHTGQEAPVVKPDTPAQAFRKYHALRLRRQNAIRRPVRPVQKSSRVVRYFKITIRIFVVKPVRFVERAIERSIKRDIEHMKSLMNYFGF